MISLIECVSKNIDYENSYQLIWKWFDQVWF